MGVYDCIGRILADCTSGLLNKYIYDHGWFFVLSIAPATLALACCLLQLVHKATTQLDNEIACISLNPPSNQLSPGAISDAEAMETHEDRQLDSLVAVGMWTDMTVSPTLSSRPDGKPVVLNQM